MNAVTEWGYAFIHLVQSLRSPVGDGLFLGLSFFGSENFYLVLIPLLYWLVDKRRATRLAVLFLTSVYLNSLLKAAWHQPRPSAHRVDKVTEETGWGIPSGHAQSSFVTWGWLASQWRDRWFQLGAGALVLGIGLSRIYLGVHFPSDVFAGWLVGGALLATYFALVEPYLEPWFQAQPLGLRMGLSVALVVSACLVFRNDVSLRAMGTLCGLALGVPLERRHLAFNETAFGSAQIVLRLLLGCAGTLAIELGLKPVLQSLGEPEAFLRYACIGFWVTFAAPWLFLKTGLCRREFLEIAP